MLDRKKQVAIDRPPGSTVQAPGSVAGKSAVGDRSRAQVVVDAAAMSGPVSAQCAVVDREWGVGPIVVDAAAVGIARVGAQCAVVNRECAALIGDAGAKEGVDLRGAIEKLRVPASLKMPPPDSTSPNLKRPIEVELPLRILSSIMRVA